MRKRVAISQAFGHTWCKSYWYRYKLHRDTAGCKDIPKHIQSSFYIKKAGIKLGTIIRGELIPAHEFAISTIINPDVPAIEVDKETALQYLRRQEIKLDPGCRGWSLLTYRQLALGWIKALPNRVNNYYPKEWRIINK